MTQSRQAKWQEKMKAEGRCRQCGLTCEEKKTYCNSCRKKLSIRRKVVDKAAKIK